MKLARFLLFPAAEPWAAQPPDPDSEEPAAGRREQGGIARGRGTNQRVPKALLISLYSQGGQSTFYVLALSREATLAPRAASAWRRAGS